MLDLDKMSSVLIFFVNGRKVVEDAVNPEWTLLHYLRNKLRLCGTKLGCGDGGCGACTVMFSKYDVDKDEVIHYSANACLMLVASVHGLAITTVEGIGSTRTGLHTVQERIANAHGSQCGFCTPGIVMSMYTLLRNNPVPSMAELDEYFAGNLCRCTGYRPILDGFRSLTSDGPNSQGCGRIDCCKLKSGQADAATKERPNGEGMCANKEASDESNITRILYDESLFRPYDPTQELIFPPELKMCPELQREDLEFRGPRVTFFRPSSLSHLLHLKAIYPSAKLIVGNTEVGLEVKVKNQLYPVLINPGNVAELKCVTVKETGVVFGASVTLTTIEKTLRDLVQCQEEYKTRAFVAVIEMLKWFAGKQIRNTAAIGGNIMTGSPISDLNPLLMAAGATLTLCSKGNGERQVVMDHNFFTGYRETVAKPEEILLNIHVPYTQKGEYFYGYKQARRRNDDIAIVNSGMRVVFTEDSDVVKHLDLAFGGMGPTTVMAKRTMKDLVGRQWNSSLLETATSLLLEDLQLLPSALGGMTEYRQALSVSLFFKFYLSVRRCLGERLPSLVPPLTWDEERVIQLHHQEMPKSTQLFQKAPASQSSLDPIGRPMVHTSALKQATGEAVFVDDMPHLENELHAALVLSTHAHAKIIAIDESEALKVEGVVDFFCARDLPGERNMTGAVEFDEEVFANEKVICIGQLIGLVVAKDKATAQRAAKLVSITYDDIKPIVITIEDAIREDSYFSKWTVNKGDVEKVFLNSTHVLEGEVYMGGQEHFYLEPNAHLAVPKGEDGEMEVFTSCQNPKGTQSLVAKALDVPANRIYCKVKRIGGGFGGKESRTTCISVPVCFAASVLNRPVRITVDRSDDMVMTGKRHSYLCRWKVGFSEDGLFSAISMDVYANGGCTLDYSDGVIQKAMLCMDSAYKCENMLVRGFACKTNLPSNTACRGTGGPQGTMFSEDIVSRVAAFLKKDPNMIRERNLYTTGDVTFYNQLVEGCTIRRCWDEVIEQAQYSGRKSGVESFNRENRYRKRGLSTIPLKYGVSFPTRVLNQAGALVLVYTDGSVLLSHGGIEMGQGLHTKMIQVAARVLQISADKIHIADTSTDKVPNASPSAASSSSDLNGMAVKEACEKIMYRLEPYISRNPKGSWEDWVKAAYFDRVSLSATGFYNAPNVIDFDFEKGEGRPFDYFTYGAAVTEVEIDCLTGDYSVLRTDIVMDIGESLNPAIDIGQVEGAFMQGLGLFTLEELCYSPAGTLLTQGTGSYKIPGFQDIPREFNVSLLRGTSNPRAVYSSKGVGEPPLLLAASVFFAIKEAIGEARKDFGLTPVYRLDSPATAERIRMACQDFITEKIEQAEPGSFIPWSITA